MSVRILKGDKGDGSNAPRPTVSFAASARRITAASWEARLESERRITEANARAEAIVAEANARADAVAEAARAKGAARANAECVATLARVQQREAALLEASVDVLSMAVRAVSERVVGRALATDDATLAGWAREALAPLKGARRVSVRCHSSTRARLSARLNEIAPDAIAALELVADDTLAPDALEARSDLGGASISLGTQLDELVLAIREGLVGAVARRNPRPPELPGDG